MKHYSLYLPILPVHHPNKNLSTLAPSSPVLKTLYTTIRKQHEEKKLPKKRCHMKQRKDQNQSYPRSSLSHWICLRERKNPTLLTVKPTVYQRSRNQQIVLTLPVQCNDNSRIALCLLPRTTTFKKEPVQWTDLGSDDTWYSSVHCSLIFHVLLFHPKALSSLYPYFWILEDFHKVYKLFVPSTCQNNT